MRSVARVLRLLAAAFTVLLTLTVVLVVATQTPWFKGWLRGLAVRQANKVLNGQLSIGRLDGNLFSGVSLENVAVTMGPDRVIAIDKIVVRYDVAQMISQGISIARLEVTRPVLHLVRRDDAWNIGRMIKPRKEPDKPNDGRRRVEIRELVIVDGAVAVGGEVPSGAFRMPHAFDHIDAALTLGYQQPGHWSFDLDRVAFTASDPALEMRQLSGLIVFEDRAFSFRNLAVRTAASSLLIDGSMERHVPSPVIDLAVVSETLTLSEIAPLVPALRNIALEPSFELKLEGPGNRLAIDLNVRSAAGHVSGTLVADFAGPRQSIAGDVRLEHLDLVTIFRNPEAKTDVTGKATFEVSGQPLNNAGSLRWSVAYSGPHAAALGYEADDVSVRAEIAGPRIAFDGKARGYGAEATGKGVVTLKGDTRPLSYEVSGVAHHVDLRQLPRHLNVPQAASDINAAYSVRGFSTPGPRSRREVMVSGQFEPSTLEGMGIAAGGTAGLTVRDSLFEYQADATVADLNLQRIGDAFNLGALRRDRLASALNGHVTTHGSWTTIRDLSLVADGTLTSSSMPGGHIGDLTFSAALADDVLRVKGNGHFDNVELQALVAPRPLAGRLAGSLDAEATLAAISTGVAADRIDVTGRVDLQESTVGRLTLNRVTIDGDYHPTQSVIRVLEIEGHAVSAQAEGTLALDETGTSKLTYRLESSDLKELGALIDEPLEGTAAVDGTVTGNRRELVLAGHASANQVTYANASALVLAADYTARLPQLSARDLSVTATTEATLVSVAGQNINELTAKLAYAARQLEFDATGRQPRRTLAVAGTVNLVPEQREVRVQRLAAVTEGMAWELAPETRPLVRYGNGVVAVTDLRLQSGDQVAIVDGTFGRPGERLSVTLDNLDLASVDQLLLRPSQLSGRLHASGIVTGSTDAPQVRAEVQVRAGGFRQFKYEDLSGTIDYGGKGMTIDVKLQQNAAAWLTARGYLPVALFKGPGNAPAEGPAAAEDNVDLKIESSPIDLGVVQAFTTALSNVTGTLQANLQLTGAAADPRPGGSLDIRDAAFTVVEAGVSYTGGTGRVEFKGDRVHIDQLRVLDNQKKALLVSGDLAIRERDLSGVDIMVQAADFKVIDNKIGNVRINSDLHIVGELSYPRIEGTLGISTGVIDVDELVDATTDSAYTSKTAAATDAMPRADGRPEPPAEPGFFDALQMQIHVTVPNDLVVKGSDLRLPDAPVGLGALNITLGGDLWVSKTPWDRPRLTGVVNTVRGTYEFQGRRFDILRDGTARFDGLDEKSPEIDIRAERLIQGVRANVNLRGTLRHPDLVLTSSPPLDQADILALIVFNQPANQIGAGQQLNLLQRARSMALGAVAVQLANSIGGALELDTFEIQIAPDSGSAAQVTVGQQVGQNLFLKVEQGVGDQSNTNVVVEYQLNKWLSLQSNYRQNSSTVQLFQRVQGTGTDLIFQIAY